MGMRVAMKRGMMGGMRGGRGCERCDENVIRLDEGKWWVT